MQTDQKWNPQKPSPFRIWVQEIYFQNKDERLLHHESELRLEEYWRMYKWWLKREYVHQTRRST
jgi:hypothetical protein